MDIKEKKHEKVSNSAITEVNSSIMLDSDLSVTCREVITNRQSPKRFADVVKICWDVLLAITIQETIVFLLFPFQTYYNLNRN